MMYIVQFISHKSGHRSDVFTVTLDDLASKLYASFQEHTQHGDVWDKLNDYVLVIGSFEEGHEDQMDWIKAPLITFETLLKSHYPEAFLEETA